MLKLLMIGLLATTAVSAAAAGQQGEKRERRICKRDVKTGSLVQAKRTCLTAEEWKETQRRNRDTVEEWQEAIDGENRSN